MRKLLAGCLALCIPALLTAQTPADSISRTEAIDSVVVTARRPLMVYKQTGNIAVDIEQLKYAPLFAGEKDIFKFLQLLPGVSAGKDGMSGLLVRGGSTLALDTSKVDCDYYNFLRGDRSAFNSYRGEVYDPVFLGRGHPLGAAPAGRSYAQKRVYPKLLRPAHGLLKLHKTPKAAVHCCAAAFFD